jgi:hypothetical protein
MTSAMRNGLMLIWAAVLAGCAPQVIYMPAVADAQAPAPAGPTPWDGTKLRTAASLCGSQENWVTGLVAMRDAGYQQSEATAWMGSELSTAFEQSEVDSRSEAGGLAIVLAAGVVESVYTQPYGSVAEELASWENACFNWLAEAMASTQ